MESGEVETVKKQRPLKKDRKGPRNTNMAGYQKIRTEEKERKAVHLDSYLYFRIFWIFWRRCTPHRIAIPRMQGECRACRKALKKDSSTDQKSVRTDRDHRSSWLRRRGQSRCMRFSVVFSSLAPCHCCGQGCTCWALGPGGLHFLSFSSGLVGKE